MVLEAETGFHFRRAGQTLRLAMNEPTPRWTDREDVDTELVADWRERIAHRFPRRCGRTGRTLVGRALRHDARRAPDHRLGRRRRVRGVRLLGHGFMQSPAVGKAVAEELLDGESPFDLSPYRLERFADGAVFPEELIL